MKTSLVKKCDPSHAPTTTNTSAATSNNPSPIEVTLRKPSRNRQDDHAQDVVHDCRSNDSIRHRCPDHSYLRDDTSSDGDARGHKRCADEDRVGTEPEEVGDQVSSEPWDEHPARGNQDGALRVDLLQIALETDHEQKDDRAELREEHHNFWECLLFTGVAESDEADLAESESDDDTHDNVCEHLGLPEPGEYETREKGDHQ
jgi:hypothetical protein